MMTFRVKPLPPSKTELMRVSGYGNLHYLGKMDLTLEMINWQDDRGRTALMYAAMFGRTKVIKFLLDKGADPSLKDVNGLTALSYASSYIEPYADGATSVHVVTEMLSFLLGK